MAAMAADDNDKPDLVCHLDSVQGMVDALTSVRWKKHQVSIPLLSIFRPLIS